MVVPVPCAARRETRTGAAAPLEISRPWPNSAAKETGYGFAFSGAQDPVASLVAATAPRDPEPVEPEVTKTGRKAKARPSHLQIIK